VVLVAINQMCFREENPRVAWENTWCSSQLTRCVSGWPLEFTLGNLVVFSPKDYFADASEFLVNLGLNTGDLIRDGQVERAGNTG